MTSFTGCLLLDLSLSPAETFQAGPGLTLNVAGLAYGRWIDYPVDASCFATSRTKYPSATT